MTSLLMDPGEILREYNAATNKNKQIAVLADLNCCKPLEIALVLREQGAEFSKAWQDRLAIHDETEQLRALLPQRVPLHPAKKAAVPIGEPLTAGALQQLLGRIPGDTLVEILGPSGVATSALFLERVDMQGSSYVLEIQREERP